MTLGQTVCAGAFAGGVPSLQSSDDDPRSYARFAPYVRASRACGRRVPTSYEFPGSRQGAAPGGRARRPVAARDSVGASPPATGAGRAPPRGARLQQRGASRPARRRCRRAGRSRPGTPSCAGRLNHLDDESRDLLALHDVGEMPLSQLAKLVEHDRKTVRTRLARARRRLSHWLGGTARRGRAAPREARRGPRRRRHRSCAIRPRAAGSSAARSSDLEILRVSPEHCSAALGIGSTGNGPGARRDLDRRRCMVWSSARRAQKLRENSRHLD